MENIVELEIINPKKMESLIKQKKLRANPILGFDVLFEEPRIEGVIYNNKLEKLNSLIKAFETWYRNQPLNTVFYGFVDQEEFKAILTSKFYCIVAERHYVKGNKLVLHLCTKEQLIGILTELTKQITAQLSYAHFVNNGIKLNHPQMIRNLNISKRIIEIEESKYAKKVKKKHYLKIIKQFIKEELKFLKEDFKYSSQIVGQPENDEITFSFVNNFDKVEPVEVYNYFKKSLVDKGYLSLDDLKKYLIMAFENKELPKSKFTFSNLHIEKVRTIFYTYFKDIAINTHGKKEIYADLLGGYFNSFTTKKVMNNFADGYKIVRK
ncbi:hypothetical protein [Lacinutrix himadriensis]|uniref:hypothetical protein n=1 Tax=Lacinutrix himadriensis TaxID=641549 RepID=UPI0006E3F14A|nr:hypothetical protein [Lacinutrix himadriensis]